MIGVDSREYWPLKAVCAFTPNDVWVASNAELVHWDGSTWTSKAFFMIDIPFDGQVLKMWGTSGNNIYCVGRTGAIYHYNGIDWTKIESGTTLDIQDIYGAIDKRTGEYEILAVASITHQNSGNKILKIKNNDVSFISENGLTSYANGLWFIPGMKYYIVGFGISPKNSLDDPQPWTIYPPGDVTSYYTNSISGNAINDVVAAGAYGEIVHFNGYSWKNYNHITGLPSGSYDQVEMKGDLIIAVGYNSPRAKAVIGIRSK
jgi:hypothetical protein